MEHNPDDRPPVTCFTCPRERRGDEPGWHFVDVPTRPRANGLGRVFVCPRHYRQFAEPERSRWTEVLCPPAPDRVAAAATAWVEPSPALSVEGVAAGAVLAVVETIASEL